METKKWSTKKKVLVSILVILCAAIIAGVLYMFFKAIYRKLRHTGIQPLTYYSAPHYS